MTLAQTVRILTIVARVTEALEYRTLTYEIYHICGHSLADLRTYIRREMDAGEDRDLALIVLNDACNEDEIED